MSGGSSAVGEVVMWPDVCTRPLIWCIDASTDCRGFIYINAPLELYSALAVPLKGCRMAVALWNKPMWINIGISIVYRLFCFELFFMVGEEVSFNCNIIAFSNAKSYGTNTWWKILLSLSRQWYMLCSSNKYHSTPFRKDFVSISQLQGKFRSQFWFKETNRWKVHLKRSRMVLVLSVIACSSTELQTVCSDSVFWTVQ